jgi:hypothetical protein
MRADTVTLGSLAGQTSSGHPHLVAAHVMQPQWTPSASRAMSGYNKYKGRRWQKEKGRRCVCNKKK